MAEPICDLWMAAVGALGGAVAALYGYQLCVTTMDTKHKICCCAIKRVMQIIGLFGSFLFIIGWELSAAECGPDTNDRHSFESRTLINFALDGLSSSFVLQYLLGTCSFLHAVASTSRRGRAGTTGLLLAAAFIVIGWLALDTYQVLEHKEWISAVFYWWLMGTLWASYLYCCVVAFRLTRLLHQPDPPAREGLLTPVSSARVDGQTLRPEDLAEQVRKAKKVTCNLQFLLLSTLIALVVASWFWVDTGYSTYNNGDADITAQKDLGVSVAFNCLHGMGLLIGIWWLWQRPDRPCCGKKPVPEHMGADPDNGQWFDASYTEGARLSSVSTDHSVNSQEIRGRPSSVFESGGFGAFVFRSASAVRHWLGREPN